MDDRQREVTDFLRDPANHRDRPRNVDVIETHGAMVFLAGDDAFKIKRDVKLPYLDYSTLQCRHAMCRREFEINVRTAPQIYNGVVALTREADGSLAMDGDGEPVEWAVRMNRFNQECLLSAIASRGEFDDRLTRDLAATIAEFHDAAEPVRSTDGTGPFAAIIAELMAVYRDAGDVVPPRDAEQFEDRAGTALAECSTCLHRRARNGHVRRCHGDLHLNNIVIIDDQPVLFDAIEFDDAIATIDTLYDLAFLLMDLDHRGLQSDANLLLNRYLFHTRRPHDLAGMQALPLFLSCRAGIRAMVAVQRGRQMAGQTADKPSEEAAEYFCRALHYLDPAAPELIAVGGASGTGKSTLSASLAPRFGAPPGAIHLRSDLERKSMFGVSETTRLDDECYTEGASARVYERLLAKAGMLLRSGRSVVVDAVFSRPGERAAAAGAARETGAKFHGLWLDAPADQLHRRLDARRGDASDATSEIADAQLARPTGTIDWIRVEAGGSRADTLAAAWRKLSLG